MIDNGNSGFVGEKVFNFIYDFFPIIENDFLNLGFLFLAICFFILGSSINLKKLFAYFFKKTFNKSEEKEITLKNEIQELNQENPNQCFFVQIFL